MILAILDLSAISQSRIIGLSQAVKLISVGLLAVPVFFEHLGGVIPIRRHRESIPMPRLIVGYSQTDSRALPDLALT